jgi:hypothetical protein
MSLAQISPSAAEHPTNDVRCLRRGCLLGASSELAHRGERVRLPGRSRRPLLCHHPASHSVPSRISNRKLWPLTKPRPRVLCLCAGLPRVKLRLQLLLYRDPQTRVILSDPQGAPKVRRGGKNPSFVAFGLKRWGHPKQLAHPSCNSQLQLAAFLRSADYRGLNWHLSPFRINTSKNLCAFCISLISGHLKSVIINTSVNFDLKPPRINTSKKQGGGGPVATPVATGNSIPAESTAGRRLQPRSGESAVADDICVAHLCVPCALCGEYPAPSFEAFGAKAPKIFLMRFVRNGVGFTRLEDLGGKT